MDFITVRKERHFLLGLENHRGEKRPHGGPSCPPTFDKMIFNHAEMELDARQKLDHTSASTVSWEMKNRISILILQRCHRPSQRSNCGCAAHLLTLEETLMSSAAYSLRQSLKRSSCSAFCRSQRLSHEWFSPCQRYARRFQSTSTPPPPKVSVTLNAKNFANSISH